VDKFLSARHPHCGIVELRNHRIIGDLITITLNTTANLAIEIFLVDITLRLSFTKESNNFENQTIVNLTRVKFDGIEVNNHVSTFCGELHLVRIPLTLLIYRPWHLLATKVDSARTVHRVRNCLLQSTNTCFKFSNGAI